MAEKLVYQLDINSAKSEKTLSQLNDELAQMRRELEEIPTGTKEFKRLAREISKTQSQVKNLEASFEGMGIEQKLTAATDVASGLAGGFAAIQGAMLLVGEESEEFEKAMSKAMGAMAFATGIKDIGVMVVQMNKLGVVTKIQTAIQTAFNFVLSANPIGLVVIAIGALIAGIIALQKPIQNAIAKFESMNAVAKVLIMILGGPLLATIYAVTKALEFFGVINSKTQNDAITAAEKRRRAEIKAHKQRIQEINKEIDALDDQIAKIREGRKAVELRYDREIELARAAGKDTTRLEGEKLDDTIERVRKEIIALEERYALEQKRMRETIELAKKQRNSENHLTRAVGDLIVDNQKEVTEGITAERRKEIDEAEKVLDELLHDREVHSERVLKQQRDAAREAQKQRDEEAAERARKEEEEREARIEALKDEHERMLDLDREFQKERERIRQQEAKEREEAIKAEQEGYANMVAFLNDQQEAQTKREQRTRELRVDYFNEEFEKRIAIVDQYFSSFSQLNSAFNSLQDSLRKKDEESSLKQQKNRFNREKAFNIASAAIDTSKAIMGAVAASPVTFGMPFSAFAATTGALQIAAIAAQKFNPTGGGSSVSIPAPSFSSSTNPQNTAPNPDGIDPETLLNGGGTGGGSGTPQRVYVTEGDITRTQNRVNQIATIRET